MQCIVCTEYVLARSNVGAEVRWRLQQEADRCGDEDRIDNERRPGHGRGLHVLLGATPSTKLRSDFDQGPN
jgi:hypothetical protein